MASSFSRRFWKRDIPGRATTPSLIEVIRQKLSAFAAHREKYGCVNMPKRFHPKKRQERLRGGTSTLIVNEEICGVVEGKRMLMVDS